MERQKKLKINLGCGVVTPQGWINMDGSLNAYFARYKLIRELIRALHIIPKEITSINWNPKILIHDVRKKLPFDDNAAEVVYASHLLEHLYLVEADNLLKECFRILMPGGILRIMVPDLRKMTEVYVRESGRGSKMELSGDRFVKKMGFRNIAPPQKGLYRFLFYFQDMHTHKWMYDEASLKKHISNAGFTNIRRNKRFISKIANIRKIEKNHGLIIEAEKPKHDRF